MAADINSLLIWFPKLLAMARQANRPKSRTVAFIEGSAEQIPPEKGTIDTIVMTWALCSIPDPARALREIHRPLDKALHSRSAFLRVERGDQRAGPLSCWPQPAPGTIFLQSRDGSRSPRTI
jgi:SAM-dependent methyltransferase